MRGQLWGGPHDGERISLTQNREVIDRPCKRAPDALRIPRPLPIARYRWDGTSRWVYEGILT